MGPFAIGQPVDRKEDPILLRGEGRYAADVALPGAAFAVFVRSRYAHGTIQAIETGEAAAMPGVLGVYTQADLEAAGVRPMPPAQAGKNHDGTDIAMPKQSVLASGRVRYVGHRLRGGRDTSAGARCRRGGDRRDRPAAGGDHRPRRRGTGRAAGA